MLVLALAAGLGLGQGQGSHDCGADDRGDRGTNAPCTRSRDCDDGLACVGGVCGPPDASTGDP